MAKRTLAQIQKQIDKLQSEAQAIRAREAQGVVARIKEAIAYYQLTPSDLGFGTRAKPTRKQAAKAGRKRGGARRGNSGKVKYRDDAGHTWSGHGRRPKWYLDAIAAGKTPQDLAT